MLPSFIKDRHYRKARRLCEEHVKEVRSPELVENPLLTVLFITYNHALFVRQALDSVLMQKTSFPFEIVISDDCSTDGTREIVQEYHKKHPDKIRLLLSDKNLWNFRGNKRGTVMTLALYEAGYRSKYNALLEGDDYWTRDDKLQIQVDFLESNPEYSACDHGHQVVDYSGNILEEHKVEIGGILKKNVLWKGNCMKTACVVMKNMSNTDFVYSLMSFNIAGDNLIPVVLGFNGPAYRLKDDEMRSVYRKGRLGTYSSLNEIERYKALFHNFYGILRYHISKENINTANEMFIIIYYQLRPLLKNIIREKAYGSDFLFFVLASIKFSICFFYIKFRLLIKNSII